MEQTDRTEAMTSISSKQWQFVTQENLSAKEAVQFLYSGMQTRTFRDNIKDVFGDRDAEPILTRKLYEYAQLQSSKPIQMESIHRKVRNWLNGSNYPTDRETVFQICFALELGEAQSDRLLTRLTEQGIHYRNRREMVYAYCLKHRLDYPTARNMAVILYKNHATGADSAEPMTQIMKFEFRSVQAEEDLISFMLRHQDHIGVTHNTAYAYFRRMLVLLTGEAMDGENCYSMEYIADTYLRLGVPLDKKTGNLTDIQKLVKKYWPGTRSIKAMNARSEDVTRKTLLLMYIVTGGIWDKVYDESDESYIQPKEFLEIHCKRMNRMLTECGMSRIDPRNVFDYLVLYCLRPEDELFMSDRMETLAAEIFNTP